ncbi:hypothetical protein D3C72_2194330 [compost metagenome]
MPFILGNIHQGPVVKYTPDALRSEPLTRIRQPMKILFDPRHDQIHLMAPNHIGKPVQIAVRVRQRRLLKLVRPNLPHCIGIDISTDQSVFLP